MISDEEVLRCDWYHVRTWQFPEAEPLKVGPPYGKIGSRCMLLMLPSHAQYRKLHLDEKRARTDEVSVSRGDQLSALPTYESKFSTQSTALGSTCAGIFSLTIRNKMAIKAVMTTLTTASSVQLNGFNKRIVLICMHISTIFLAFIMRSCLVS
jgi:hypothetical protein